MGLAGLLRWGLVQIGCIRYGVLRQFRIGGAWRGAMRFGLMRTGRAVMDRRGGVENGLIGQSRFGESWRSQVS